MMKGELHECIDFRYREERRRMPRVINEKSVPSAPLAVLFCFIHTVCTLIRV